MPVSKALLELHHLPCIAYMSFFCQFDEIYLEANESFQKQSYRNRCYINSAQGQERLTIPLKKANRHHPIRAVEIDYKTPWHIKYWRTIHSAYAKAPFFEYYAEDFWAVFKKKLPSLYDLNHQLLTVCLYHLDIKASLRHTDSYLTHVSTDFTDLRGKIHPKQPNGIIHAPTYVQVFGTSFVGNLSVLDLLFCEGPHAKHLLQQTKTIFVS